MSDVHCVPRPFIVEQGQPLTDARSLTLSRSHEYWMLRW
jgi:hypothetical protein